MNQTTLARVLTNRRAICGALAAALALLVAPMPAHADGAAPGQDAPPAAGEGRPRRGEPGQPPPEGERPRRGGRVAPDWPRAGGVGPAGDRPLLEGLVTGDIMRREISDADMQSAIEVARRVSPEWGDTLASRLEGDPEAFRSVLRGNARRLLALVALRERAPKVFEARVEELRAQADTQRAFEAVRGADDANRVAREAELDRAATAQVAATLRAREAEIAAIEERLVTMRKDLAADAEKTAALKDALVADLRKRAEEGPRERPQPAPRE